MTPDYYQKIQRLSRCSTIPGSFDRRFIRRLATKPEQAELTPKEIEWLDNLWWKYRRQHHQPAEKPPHYPESSRTLSARVDDLAKLERWKAAVHGPYHQNTDNSEPENPVDSSPEI